ncbi:global transactivator [Fusarium pseudoanthophilum]|uniref:Global transactivator n=1 Tax=Fusarium pseudoanthophilum TaxID=48495 RepID=A0A8H5KHR3_9HYPO|nr:global transactivator [Fusarium pseudoanthophilum]
MKRHAQAVYPASSMAIHCSITRSMLFQDTIEDYSSELAFLFPKRPKLVLRSDSLESESWKPIGKCMILDDAHIVKNRNTCTFAAVTALRGQFEGCLSLTGTPLDNIWEDGYALLSLLKGHPIADFNIFPSSFKELGKNAPRHPTGRHMIRSAQMIDAASLLNPISTIQDRLPPRTGSRKSRGKASRGKKDDGTGWLHLIEAQQHAYHPMLVQLKLAHRGLMEFMRQEDVDDAIPDDMDDQALEQVAEWCRQLEQGDNSLSSRVEAILDTRVVPGHRGNCAQEGIPSGLQRTTGRLDTVQRYLTIKKVAQVTPLHTLLASRGISGRGLNMQFANVVIRRGRKRGKSKQLNEFTDQDSRSLPLFVNGEPRTVLWKRQRTMMVKF